jgi:drug/metabolite transporter (DMT)-like permease
VTSKTNKKYKYVSLLGAAFLWGLKAVSDKQIASSSDSDLLATTIVSTFSGLVVLSYILFAHKGKLNFKRPNKRELFQMATIGAIASGFVVFLTLVGLNESSATFAALNQGVASLSTLALARIFLKEKLTKIFALAVPIMIFGTYLVSVGELKLSTIQRGDLLVLSAAALIGISNVLAKKVMSSGFSSQQVTTFRFLFGALTTLLLALVSRGAFEVDGIHWMMSSGILGGIFVLLLYDGIRSVGASITSIIIMFSPVFSAFLAWILIGEQINFVQFAGILLVIAGGVAVARK